MNDLDFIFQAGKHLTTARRNTATGEWLEEALQRLERNQTFIDYATHSAIVELTSEAVPLGGERWATAFPSKPGQLLVELGVCRVAMDVERYVYTFVKIWN